MEYVEREKEICELGRWWGEVEEERGRVGRGSGGNRGNGVFGGRVGQRAERGEG